MRVAANDAGAGREVKVQVQSGNTHSQTRGKKFSGGSSPAARYAHGAINAPAADRA
jgi:hypothetical protein